MTKEFDAVMSAFDNVNLHEAVFDVDIDGAEEYNDFRDDEAAVEDDFIDVVDVDAEDEEELKTSYLGDVILSCAVCRTPIFKAKEEVVFGEDEEGKDEEDKIVNVEEECPVCGGTSGFHIVGMVVPYVDVEVEETETEEDKGDGDEEEVEVEDTEKEEVDEALQQAVKRFALKEDAEVKMDGDDVTVETNGVTVEVNAETSDEEEMIEPIEDEETFFADEIEGEDEIDVDVDEIGEEEVEEAFVRAKPYFKSFKMKEAYSHKGKIVVEGLAKSRNGKIVREKFSLIPMKIKGNRAAFMVEGFGSHKGVVGRLNDGKLIVESFVGKRGRK